MDVYMYNVRWKEGKATTFPPPPPSSRAFWLYNEAWGNPGMRRTGEGRTTSGERYSVMGKEGERVGNNLLPLPLSSLLPQLNTGPSPSYCTCIFCIL